MISLKDTRMVTYCNFMSSLIYYMYAHVVYGAFNVPVYISIIC